MERRAFLTGAILTTLVSGCGRQGRTPREIPDALDTGGGEPESELVRQEKARVYATIPPDEDRRFRRLDAGKDTDWLRRFREPVQPLERYQRRNPLRPTPERRTIVLQPLGDLAGVSAGMLETLRWFTAAFFQLPARIAPPLPLPTGDGWTRPRPQQRKPWDTQYNADRLLNDYLYDHLPEDAVVCLGVTMTDLWSGGLNFVFGIGSLRGGVGVYSLCRYFPAFFNEPRRPDDASVSLLRACKVLSHETGHLFGITHCVFYRCGMNGVNSRPEMDSAPLDFCPVCERKLRWNIGYDPVRRTAELARLQGRTTPAG